MLSGIQQLVGAAYICIGVGALGFLKPALENPDTGGSRSFVAFTLAVAAYAVTTGIDLFTTDYALSLLAQSATNCAGVLVGVAWLFLAIEVSERIRITRRLVGLFAIYVLCAWIVALSNPGGIVLRPTDIVGTQMELNAGIGFWFLLGMAWVHVFIGMGLLVAESWRATGLREKQTGLLALAIVPSLVASITTAIAQTRAVVGYDYTVLGWAGTLVLFAVALYSSRFLRIETVARRTAMEAMDDAMVTLDAQNRVIDANTRALTVLDIDGAYAGMSVSEFFRSVPTAVRQQFAESTDTMEEATVTIDGRERQFLISVSPVGDGANRGRVIVFRDITDQKRRERRLRQQREQLDQFASVVSHDLRNPLSVVQGNLRLIRDDIPADRVETMQQGLDRMEAMIDDLLTMSQAGKTVESPERVSLQERARTAWTHVDTAEGTLTLDVTDEQFVWADSDRLLHLFENLFRNAVEHNDPPLTLRVGTVGEVADGRGFFVEDDGGGIPETERDAVFEHGYTNSDDGTGLGLSIVQDIVDAHGWDIGLTESEDGGARFEITAVEFAESSA